MNDNSGENVVGVNFSGRPGDEPKTPRQLLLTALQDVDDIENLIIAGTTLEGRFCFGSTNMNQLFMSWIKDQFNIRVMRVLSGRSDPP